jgi:hypothetical protein
VTRTIGFLKDNAIALVALFIALGGTSYAAVAIPKDSVGSTQLRKGAVTSSKIHSGAITPGKLSSKAFGGRILYFAEIGNNGAVEVSDPAGVKTEDWNMNSGGGVIFPRPIPKGCFPLAGAASTFTGQAGGAPSVGAGIQNSTLVAVAVTSSVPVTLAIVCTR